jgi:hypothetical protein
MQRAAASSNRSASTIADTTTRNAADPPSAKRQKLTDSESSTPGTPNFTAPHSTDLHIVSASLAAEERSRSEARLRSAAAGGETEWVLNLPGANGSMNGHLGVEDGGTDRAQDDEEVEEDEIWRDHPVGRRSYGDFKRKKAQVGASSSNNPDEDAEELSEGEVSDTESSFSQNTPKKAKQQDVTYEDVDKKRWRAMDRMNLKGQNQISGFSPKRALHDRTSNVRKKAKHSFKS